MATMPIPLPPGATPVSDGWQVDGDLDERMGAKQPPHRLGAYRPRCRQQVEAVTYERRHKRSA
jgi:hypothetical protein